MKLVIDIPYNMQGMCGWHTDDICALTNIEVDILAEAIKNGTELTQSVWVGIDDEPHEDWECGNCGFLFEGMDFPEIKQMHYCPGCGAEMVGATDA